MCKHMSVTIPHVGSDVVRACASAMGTSKSVWKYLENSLCALRPGVFNGARASACEGDYICIYIYEQ